MYENTSNDKENLSEVPTTLQESLQVLIPSLKCLSSTVPSLCPHILLLLTIQSVITEAEMIQRNKVWAVRS